MTDPIPAATGQRSAAPAAALAFELTYWAATRYQVTLSPAAVVAELRAAGHAEAAGIAARAARSERAWPGDHDADQDDARALAAALAETAARFGADSPAGEPADWENPDDYQVRARTLPNPPARPAGPLATVAQLPPLIRLALARTVAWHQGDEARDYAECGPEAGQNSRQAHIYEDLALLGRWLDGTCDGQAVEADVWVPNPAGDGLIPARRKTIGEIAEEVAAITGSHPEGAEEGLGLYALTDAGREWPASPVTVSAVAGGSEGHYVQVEAARGQDAAAEVLLLGKTFSGAAAAAALADRLARILGCAEPAAEPGALHAGGRDERA